MLYSKMNRCAKTIITLLIILVSASPTISRAVDCKDSGYSIVYINGIFTSDTGAKDTLSLIKDYFNTYSTHANDITFQLGYNPTRSGLDLIKSTMQAYDKPSKEQIDQDAKRILKQLHSKLNTKKILLLGHSQGTFYTNALYTYLLKNGINPRAIAVYNIATPASYVNGSKYKRGKYITNSTDNVINEVRHWAQLGHAPEPLPANVNIALQDNQGDNMARGHDLEKVYLAGKGKRIIKEIDNLLNTLKIPELALSKGGCYFEPEFSWKDTVQEISINLTGGLVSGVGSSAQNLGKVAVIPINIIKKGGSTITKLFTKKSNHSTQNTPKVPIQKSNLTQTQKKHTSTQPPIKHIFKSLKTTPAPKITKQTKITKTKRINYDALSKMLASLETLLNQYLTTLRSNCAGIDLSIIKYSNCIPPFEPGGYGFGGGALIGGGPPPGGPPPGGQQM